MRREEGHQRRELLPLGARGLVAGEVCGEAGWPESSGVFLQLQSQEGAAPMGVGTPGEGLCLLHVHHPLVLPFARFPPAAGSGAALVKTEPLLPHGESEREAAPTRART